MCVHNIIIITQIPGLIFKTTLKLGFYLINLVFFVIPAFTSRTIPTIHIYHIEIHPALILTKFVVGE